jgi:protein-disulfide isomerase
MNSKLSIAAAALLLALAGCSRGAGNGSASGNGGAPLPQIAAPNNGDWTQTVAATPEGGYRMGNPGAPVKLVEYGSIGCPYCALFTNEAAQPLTDRYVRSGHVSWEYRPYMIHPEDPAIFLLLRCQGPAPYFRQIEQLYATQRDWAGRLEALPQSEQQRLQALPTQQRLAAMIQGAGLDQFFRARGMPQARIDSCLNDAAALQELAGQTSRASSQEGVSGTPTFFINGEKQEAGSWAQLEPLLRNAVGS